MMRIIPVIFLLGVAMPTFCRADTLDVFPLRKGMQYSYQYRDSSDYSYYGIYILTTTGTVTYQVVDSVSVGDTLIRWTVKEIRDLMTTWYSPGNPTSYTRDSTNGYLRESLVGNHSLTCNFLLWQFPKTTYRFVPIVDSAFRFQDSSSSIFVHNKNCIISPYPGDSYDSVWFNTDSGIYSMRWNRCFDLDNMFGGYHIGYASLSSIVLGTTDEAATIPSATKLIASFPNPFNGATSISYELAHMSELTLTVCDLTGRVVSVLDEGVKPPGFHQVTFNAQGIASGAYFVRLTTVEGSNIQRILYIR